MVITGLVDEERNLYRVLLVSFKPSE